MFEEVGHDATDPFEGRIVVVSRVLGQELDDDVFAIEIPNAIGKCAASVNSNPDAPIFLDGGHLELICNIRKTPAKKAIYSLKV
jgi:hypothetical protein